MIENQIAVKILCPKEKIMDANKIIKLMALQPSIIRKTRIEFISKSIKPIFPIGFVRVLYPRESNKKDTA